jgi:hypothetical protein
VAPNRPLARYARTSQWVHRRQPRPRGPPREEPASQPRTPAGAANAVRSALRSQAYGEPDGSAFHGTPRAAESLGAATESRKAQEREKRRTEVQRRQWEFLSTTPARFWKTVSARAERERLRRFAQELLQSNLVSEPHQRASRRAAEPCVDPLPGQSVLRAWLSQFHGEFVKPRIYPSGCPAIRSDSR